MSVKNGKRLIGRYQVFVVKVTLEEGKTWWSYGESATAALSKDLVARGHVKVIPWETVGMKMFYRSKNSSTWVDSKYKKKGKNTENGDYLMEWVFKKERKTLMSKSR